MNIIITGADGFVGTNLINRISKSDHELLLIGKSVDKLEVAWGTKYSYLSYKGIEQEQLVKKIEDFLPDVLIHLAAYSTASDTFTDMQKLIDANLLFLCKVLDAVKNTNISGFIYTGSFAEYFKGNKKFDPAYLYTATKTAGRSILKYYSSVYNFKGITLCPFTIYGGIDTRKKIIDLLYDSLNSDKPLETTSGEQILDFIHVNDIADLFINIVEHIHFIPDETNFYAGTGKGYTLRELACLLEDFTGLKANINWGEREYRPRDVMYAVADISLQKKLLNWEPAITLEKGVKMYLKEKSLLND